MVVSFLKLVTSIIVLHYYLQVGTTKKHYWNNVEITMFTVLLRKVCCTEGYTERLTLSSYKKFESKKCLKKNRKYVKEKFATTRDIACTQFVLRYWVPVLSTACTEYRDYRGITKKFERNAPVLSTVYSMYGVQGLQEHHEEVWEECPGAEYQLYTYSK